MILSEIQLISLSKIRLHERGRLRLSMTADEHDATIELIRKGLIECNGVERGVSRVAYVTTQNGIDRLAIAMNPNFSP